MVNEWRGKRFCSKRQLQSLLGNLLYIHKCVKPSRVFLNRMLELLRANYEATSITLTQEFKRDLRWFERFLTAYNGTSFFDHKKVFDTVELDACLTGLGGTWGPCVYHMALPNHLTNLSIVHLEMVNILVAMRIFSTSWRRKHIQIKCDNEAVVQVLNNGKTKDPYLATVARNIWYESMSYVHLSGRDNKLADILSRWVGSQVQIQYVHDQIKNPVWMKVDHSMLELNYEI